MKKTVLISALIAAGALGFTTAASAQDVTCDDLVWGSEILADNPNIGDACLEVVEKNGILAAKFTARVVRQSVNSTIVQWQLPDGTWSSAQRRYPGRSSYAEIAGQEVRISDLQPRQELNVYLPVNEYWTLPMAEVAEVAEVAEEAAAAPPPPPPPPAPEPEPAPAALPTTATQVPGFALLGGLLLLLGGAVGFVRNRF